MGKIKITRDDAEPLWLAYEREPSVAHRNALVEHYLPLARGVANRLHRRIPVPEEELASYAVDGLFRAIPRFDRKRGNRFSTFAMLAINGAVLDQLRKDDWVPRQARRRDKPITQVGSLYRAIGVKDDGTRVSLAETVVDERQDVCPSGALDGFRELLKGTNRDCRLMLLLYYIEGLTMREIGATLGLSESRVSQMHSDFLTFARQRAGCLPAPPGSRIRRLPTSRRIIRMGRKPGNQTAALRGLAQLDRADLERQITAAREAVRTLEWLLAICESLAGEETSAGKQTKSKERVA